MKPKFILAILVLSFVCAYPFRYEITPSPNGMTFRHDRWTGRTYYQYSGQWLPITEHQPGKVNLFDTVAAEAP